MTGSKIAAPDNWREWLLTLFPEYFDDNFAPHHVEYWEWVWAIEPKISPPPFIGIWARSGGKSTGAEGGAVSLGGRGIRKYCWYVRETQEQADGSVENIMEMLESEAVKKHYPLLGERQLGKYGPRAWRRSRLSCANGFTIEAIGLDKAIRGRKIKEQRPDLIVFDDVDGEHDKKELTKKKIKTITTKILPAGVRQGLAVLGIQNLIIPHGVFSQLADGRADFLRNRIVSGPHPAVKDLQYELAVESDGSSSYVITGGKAIWEGQNLEICQEQMNSWGGPAFIKEAQHRVRRPEGALWTEELIEETRVTEHPPLVRICVGVDPPGVSAECGIIVGGIAKIARKWHGFLIADESIRGTPDVWGTAVVAAYKKWDADIIVAETNNGGDMVKHVIRTTKGGGAVSFKKVTASRGKITRAEPAQNLMAEHRLHHVGHFPETEDQQCNYVPGDPSPDRMDAYVWCFWELVLRLGRPDVDTSALGEIDDYKSRWD